MKKCSLLLNYFIAFERKSLRVITNFRIFVSKKTEQNNKRKTTMKTTILYTRVSTTTQAEDGFSLSAQERKLRAYAELNGFENVVLLTDSGLSGKTTKRPAFQQMMEMVRAGKVDAVIVYSLSRFARNTKDTLISVEELTKNGVSFHSFTEKIDTNTPTGRFFLTVLSGLGQLESEILAERVVNGQQEAKRQGKRIGQIPFGYQLAEDGQTLEPNADEQETIELVNELRSRGYTLQAIADKLEEMETKNKTGRTKWNTTQIHRIVSKAA